MSIDSILLNSSFYSGQNEMITNARFEVDLGHGNEAAKKVQETQNSVL